MLKINVLGRFQLADNSDQLQKSTEQVNEPSRFVKDDGVFLDALGDSQLLKKGVFFLSLCGCCYSVDHFVVVLTRC